MNLLNSSPTGGQIIYYLRKRLKEVDENSFLIFNYFSKSSSLISTFTWLVNYRNQESLCKRLWFTYTCTSHGVKRWLFYSKCRIEVVNRMFQNQIGKVQSISKRTLKNSWMLEYFKLLRLPNLSNISPTGPQIKEVEEVLVISDYFS